jgi:hypothetical protein
MDWRMANSRDRPAYLSIRHSPLAIRYSPLAIRHSPFAIRHSPLAIRPFLKKSDNLLTKALQEILSTVSRLMSRWWNVHRPE